jgi:hypothetical protein
MVNKTLGVGHRSDEIGAFGPFSINQAGPQLNQLESLSKIFYCFLGIKVLAGENVYVNVIPLNKGMDANMTFRYKNKSGYSPIL